ncbi:MAG: Smr/MutS family protein [candidate division Zixibacteria bacterium]|nr:Smr/MutS family protein [candidate division Zixibacteria bacterium]
MAPDQDAPIEYPIDGTLDLHQFAPDETRDVVAAYIDECLARKIYSLRIVHGKGIGVQREIVRSLLSRHPRVIGFRHESGAGSWGATVVDLIPE